MKIFRKICVGLLLGIMATQAIGADINQDLIDAIYKGDLAKVKQVAKFGANVKARSKTGQSILDIAFNSYFKETADSKKDRWEIVKYLIDNGADVNAVAMSLYNDGDTVFMRAVAGLNLEQIKYLVSKGGKVNHSGKSVLDYATYKDRDIWQYLISQGAEVTNQQIKNLYGATRSVKDDKLKDSMMQTVKDLIKINKEHINDCSSSKLLSSNLFKWAIHDGYMDMAQLLLDNGADINAKCGGYNALMSFVRNLDIVKWLVSKGADVNVKDDDGKTLLTIAIESGYYDVAEFLIDNGAKKE